MTNAKINNLESELIKTGFRYRDNEDGTYDVCYDHAQDAWFDSSSQCCATVKDDDTTWYIDCNTGYGYGEYPKADYSLLDAIKDQCL